MSDRLMTNSSIREDRDNQSINISHAPKDGMASLPLSTKLLKIVCISYNSTTKVYTSLKRMRFSDLNP